MSDQQMEDMAPEKKLFFAEEEREEAPQEESVFVLTDVDVGHIRAAYSGEALRMMAEASRFIVSARQRGARAGFSEDDPFTVIEVAGVAKVTQELLLEAKERGWEPDEYEDGRSFYAYVI